MHIHSTLHDLEQMIFEVELHLQESESTVIHVFSWFLSVLLLVV